MNSNTNSTIRAVLVAVGAILATTGVISADKWGPLMESIMVIVGALAPVASVLWSRYENNRGNKQVVAALNMPKPATEVTLATLPDHAPALAAAVVAADTKAAVAAPKP